MARLVQIRTIGEFFNLFVRRIVATSCALAVTELIHYQLCAAHSTSRAALETFLRLYVINLKFGASFVGTRGIAKKNKISPSLRVLVASPTSHLAVCRGTRADLVECRTVDVSITVVPARECGSSEADHGGRMHARGVADHTRVYAVCVYARSVALNRNNYFFKPVPSPVPGVGLARGTSVAACLPCVCVV